ncbi:MAG: OmpP1/FadL family transporter [Desulfotalea sp.]
MLKKISVLAFAGLFVAGSAMASGYRIPEQSVDSTAKAGANVASASRADAAYFNPANMSWMADTWHVQGNLSYVRLGENEYTGTYTSAATGGVPTSANGSAEDENFLLPSMFVVSPDYSGFRFGFSMVAPYGLAKRWKYRPANLVADEFSLLNIEVNPTVSYKFNEKFSVAGGVRVMYANAKVRNFLYDMEGDTIEWGWNLATSFRPTENWNISATYRSNIDLEFTEHDIVGYPTGVGPRKIITGSTSIPAAAVLTLATSFKPTEKLTVEIAIDRTFWSEYEDFTVASPDGAPYNNTTLKDWDDSNAYRIGVNYELTEKLDLMGGIAYDENPAPDTTVSFELPDSDAWLFSAGFQYEVVENFEMGMAVLYDLKQDRSLNSAESGMNGEFTNGSAWFVTVGMNYKF